MKRTLLVLLAVAFSSTALGRTDLGWIEKINGDSVDVQIIRNSNKVDAIQFLAIQQGDNVSIVRGSTSVEISLANGKRLRVDKSTPQIALQTGAIPSLSGNLMNWVGSLASKEPNGNRIVTASTRNIGAFKKLSVPLLRDNTTIVAGERKLALAWQGGKAPFEVKLVRLDTQAVEATFKTLAANRLVETINLPPGTYELVVGDSAGASWHERVIAVTSSGLPETPAEFEVLSPSLRRVISAAWLSGIDDGKWALEAYTLIAALPQHSPADNRLLQALEMGESPEIE